MNFWKLLSYYMSAAHKSLNIWIPWSLLGFRIASAGISDACFLQGTAIGKCPKNKLFRGYIDLEIQLREFERCRILYEKFLEFNPENCTTWMKVGCVFLTLIYVFFPHVFPTLHCLQFGCHSDTNQWMKKKKRYEF